jgi:hypothetical protein
MPLSQNLVSRLRIELPYLLPGLILTIILFGRVLNGEIPAGIDVHTFAAPQSQLINQFVRNAEIPGWNPYMGTGNPLVGDASFPVYYPLNVLHYFVNPYTFLALFPFIHTLILYLGTYCYGRNLELSPSGACCMALVFAGGGVAVSQSFTPMYLGGVSWLPWALLSFRLFLNERRFKVLYCVLASLSFAQIFLIGALEYCVIVGLLAVFTGFVLDRKFVATIVHLSIVTILTMALCALVLLPVIYLLPEIARTQGLQIALSGRWSFSPLQLLGLLIPKPFGAGQLSSEFIASSGRSWYLMVFMGSFPFILMIQGCARFFADRRVRFAVLLVSLFLPLAFGIYTAIYPIIYENFSLARAFRYPGKLFMPVYFGFALLAGVGWDVGLKTRFFRRSLLVVLTAFTVTYVALYASRQTMLQNRLILPMLILFMGLIVLKKVKHRYPATLIALIVLELGIAGHLILFFGPRDIFEKKPEFARLLDSKETDPPIRLGQLSFNNQVIHGGGRDGQITPLESDFNNTQSLGLNLGMPYRVGSAVFFTPFKLSRCSFLKRTLHDKGYTDLSSDRFFAITHAISTRKDDKGQVIALKNFAKVGPWVLGRFRAGPPWAGIYGDVQASGSLEESVTMLMTNDFDPRYSSVIEGAMEQRDKDVFVGEMTLITFKNDVIEFEFEARKPGYAIIRESWHSGWTAFVDGKVTPILPADAIFRAVAVPQGKHRLVMKYRCHGRAAGYWISLCSALLALALGIGSTILGLRGENGEKSVES